MMKKVLWFAFLSICLSCNFASSATYECKAQDLCTYSTYNGSRTEHCPTHLGSDKGHLFVGNSGKKDVLVCGHEGTKGCDQYETVAVYGEHTLGCSEGKSVVNGQAWYPGCKSQYKLGIYRCQSHKWENAWPKYISRCTDFSGKRVFVERVAKSGDTDKTLYCNEILEAAGTRYCKGICYGDASSSQQPAPQQQAPQQTSSNSGQTQTNNQNNSGQRNYSGVIKDKDTGEPLQFVNISVPGTQSGCTTDAEGKFGNGNNYCRLTSDTVTISYVGYETITGKKLASTGNDIKMKETVNQSEAVVISAVSNKTICERDNHGTWDAQHTTCRCPSNKPRWEGTGNNPGCLSTCTYLNRHPNEASPERLACCRAGSATKWEGSDTQGNCICITANRQVDASKQWDGTTCAVVNNPPTPEDQCTALGNIVRWDVTTSQCVCVDETKRLDGTQCVDKEAPAEEEKTPEQSCVELGDFVRWDASSSTCVCVDETNVLSNGQCVDKTDTTDQTPVVPERTPQDACNDLGQIAVWQNNECVCTDEISDFTYDEESKTGKCVENEQKKKAKALKDKTDAYKNAKDKEQSLANRTLTAATTAATGLGMMELAMGKAEQKADADAEQDMAAYMATMRCTYAGGKSVKAGPEEIELPGGNDGKLMSYRSEYIALAKSLKERKTAMDMLPGIESEEILDKAEMGLYDDESKGIEGGTYASLYRAKQGSEEDQKKIDADKEKSAKRVKYGATALAAGAAVGVAGNSLINGKLGEKLKEARKDREEKKNKSPNVKEDNRPVIQHAPNPENMKSETSVIANSTGSDAGQSDGVAGVIDSLIGTTTDKVSGATSTSGGNVGTSTPTVESQRISYDEPDVDGTKWSESQYLQCFAHFFPKDRYSSNLKSYWAKSHNSQYCSGYTGGKYIYDFKKNPNPCPQQKFKSLNAGEWEIQIRNGNKAVKGIAVCNNMAGSKEDELRDNVDAHTDNGKHCWCKITQTDLTDCLVTQKFSWEYRGEYGPVDAEDVEWFNDNKSNADSVELYPAGYYQEGQNGCLWECADACAYNLLDYGRHRQRQMHGVPQIVNFVEKYDNM